MTLPFPLQFSVPPLAMVTGGVASTDALARLRLIVSLPAGTPGGDQFPGSCQLMFTAPVQVLVAAGAAVVPESSTVAISAMETRGIRPKRFLGKRCAFSSLVWLVFIGSHR